MSALDRLKAYSAGRQLVELLDTDVRPRDVADRVAALAAAVAEEARTAAAAAAPAVANGGGAAAAADAAAAIEAFAAARAVLEGVSMTSPWGKHDIGFGADALLLRGSQRVIAVPYSAIQHVAILEQIPKEPKDKNCVVLALRRGSDVRAGKARLDVIVATTKAAPQVSVKVPPGCEHLSDTGALAGPAAVVLCQLLGAHLPDIQEDTFTSSDPSVFRAPNGHLAVAANARAAAGWLFPLPAALLFLGKPSHFVRHSEIAGLEFARVGAASSTFDLTVHLSGGGGSGSGSRVEFGQIDQADLPRLQAYVAECKLPIGPPGSAAAPRQAAGGGGAKRSAEAAAAAAAANGGHHGAGSDGGGGDDDDSDEDDSDFDPEAAERGPRPAKRARGQGSAHGGEASADGGSDDDDDDDDDDDSSGSEQGDDDEDEDEDSDDVSLVDSDDLSGDDSGGGGGRGAGDDDDGDGDDDE